MTRLFYGFVAIGAVLILVLAALYPLPENQRYRSQIAVIPDGGRQESFIIRWPQDRLQPTPAGAGSGLLVAQGANILAANGAPGASAETFRVRDVEGNVIGLASRTSSRHAAAAGSDWILLLPSRGTLFLTQTDSRDVAPRSGPPHAVPIPAASDVTFWAGETHLVITGGPAADGRGEIFGGTGEFEGMRGTYAESWELEEVTGEGATRGRITLETRLQAAQ